MARNFRHVLVIKDVVEGKPASSTMALMGALKMKPDSYKSVVNEVAKTVSPEMELQLRITSIKTDNKVSFRPYLIPRLISQGFVRPQGHITVSQLYDVFKLTETIDEKLLNKPPLTEVERARKLRCFLGHLRSFQGLKIKQ
eukprot:TRINITY_DN6349_c0_g1_i1.p1 TRINITY_DN6349_c0_g1~~TRINITY_DN6349_c0_g1_i1.p1  ORF type:complete len:141 (-),score=13.22 TRINITY_DN6349_c0_g1_i1:173-595(-)